MPELFPFFLILFVALFFSEVFSRVHMPWVVALIISGMIIGPFGLDIFTPDETINLLGEIGIVFLMFMAGLEVRLSSLAKMKKEVARMSLLNGMIPFALGFGLGMFFGYGLMESLLLGTIFVSSSVAVIIPSLEANKLLDTRLGKTIVSSVVIQDIVSLLFLSIILQSVKPLTDLPLPVFYILLFAVLVALRWLLPKIRLFFFMLSREKSSLFEWELQAIFVILLGTVVFFQFIGLHAIIAGFFAGLVLAESIKSDILMGKIRAISYGFFIPIFFVLVGINTNLGVFIDTEGTILLLSSIIISFIAVKFISGWIGGRINGFNSTESILIGGSTIPQLTTTLAVAITASEFNLFSQELVTVIIVLSIITTLVGPIIMRLTKVKLDANTLGPDVKYEEA
ncbi:MAG: cation:proton antiporter [Candidatus Spechtbacterales bacterium]